VHPDGSPMLGALLGCLLSIVIWWLLALLAAMAVIVIMG